MHYDGNVGKIALIHDQAVAKDPGEVRSGILRRHGLMNH
jgi:hypothetical protein